MSGYTTTGATVLTTIESQPESILLWRNFTQWLGGMGIITLFVAFFPLFGMGAAYMVEADEQISLFEYALQKILLRHLDIASGRARSAPPQLYCLKPVVRECAVLLSTLAHLGAATGAEAAQAFAAGAGKLLLPAAAVTLLPAEQVGLGAVDGALERLAALAPLQKRSIIDACTTCVLADRDVTPDEGELLRAVADALGCPMPPFLPGAVPS